MFLLVSGVRLDFGWIHERAEEDSTIRFQSPSPPYL